MTVMFAFFVISVIGIQFYREQGWGTWDRLRIASGTMEILVGKIAPGLLLLLLQLVVVFVAGALLFHLHVAGSVAALVLIAIAFAICIMAMTMMMIASTQKPMATPKEIQHQSLALPDEWRAPL